MKYTARISLPIRIIATLVITVLVWVVLVIACSPFYPEGPPVSNPINVYLFLLSLLTASGLVHYYTLKNSYHVVMEDNMIHFLYNKLQKMQDVHATAADIEVFEIISLEEEPNEVDCYRMYVRNCAPVEFTDNVVPLQDIVTFCKQNNIEPRRVTISLSVWDVKFKRKQMIIEYYGAQRNTVKLAAKDTSHIELLRYHPVSTTQDVYRVYSISGATYDLDNLVALDKLDKYASANGINIGERKMYI